MGTRLMRRLLPLLLLTTVAVAVAVGASAAVFTVKIAKNGAIGSIVVSGVGLTLYHDTREARGSLACTGGCAKTWLPLTVSAGVKPTGGAGITASKLGTVRRSDGRVQVTYGGLALYRYVNDAKAGDANGQGKDKRWYAVTPAGRITKLGATSPAAKSSDAGAGSAAMGGAPADAGAAADPGAGAGAGAAAAAAGECPAGQTIPQGGMMRANGDGDEDNSGAPSDGDGCL
jgi:predicted lipoprotein with Yx(FWY)xxD motif